MGFFRPSIKVHATYLRTESKENSKSLKDFVIVVVYAMVVNAAAWSAVLLNLKEKFK